jgi:hypothetical protein
MRAAVFVWCSVVVMVESNPRPLVGEVVFTEDFQAFLALE